MQLGVKSFAIMPGSSMERKKELWKKEFHA